jgi:hypothetical protein
VLIKIDMRAKINIISRSIDCCGFGVLSVLHPFVLFRIDHRYAEHLQTLPLHEQIFNLMKI